MADNNWSSPTEGGTVRLLTDLIRESVDTRVAFELRPPSNYKLADQLERIERKLDLILLGDVSEVLKWEGSILIPPKGVVLKPW